MAWNTMQTEVAPPPAADPDIEIKLDARQVNFFYGDTKAGTPTITIRSSGGRCRRYVND